MSSTSEINSQYLRRAYNNISRIQNWHNSLVSFNSYQLKLVSAGYSELIKFRNDIRRNPGKYKEEYPFILDFNVDLSNSEKKRMRYAHSFTENWYPQLGPRWGVNFTLYFKIIPYRVRKHVIRMLTCEFEIQTIKRACDLYAFLKEVGTVFKQLNDYITPHWKYFINLETFGGHVSGEYTPRDRVDIYNCYVKPYPKHFNDDDVDGHIYQQHLNYHISQLPQYLNKREVECLTISEWLSNPNNYCLSGTTFLPIKLRVGDERPRKSKGAAFLHYTVDELRHYILSFDRGQVRAMAKRETGKIRYVGVSDDHTYLQMAYVSHYFENAIAGSDVSTLFMNNDQIYEMKSMICAYLTDGDTVHLPLDQSEFDHQPSKDTILCLVKMIHDFCPPNSEYRRVAKLLYSEIKVGAIIKLPDGEEIVYQKGIVSGWRWTALLDTLLNVAMFNMAVDYLVHHYHCLPPVHMFNAQGDDDMIILSSFESALVLVDIYKQFGIKVNIKKFFISNKYNEYLRIVYDSNGSSGYPARSIISLMYNNPINKEPPAGLLRARQQATNWYVAIDRGLDCYSHMLRDIANGNKLTQAEVETWLHTPAVIGGMGVFPYHNDTWLSISEGTFQYDGDLHNIRLVNVDQYSYKLIRPMLDASKHTTFKSGEIQALKPFEPLRHVPLSSKYALKPRFKSSNTFENNYCLEYYIDQRNWTELDKLFDIESAELSRLIRRKASYRVYIDWLRGKLPYHMPKVEGWSPADLSPIWNKLSMLAFGAVLLHRKIDYRMIQRSALRIELIAHKHAFEVNLAR